MLFMVVKLCSHHEHKISEFQEYLRTIIPVENSSCKLAYDIFTSQPIPTPLFYAMLLLFKGTLFNRHRWFNNDKAELMVNRLVTQSQTKLNWQRFSHSLSQPSRLGEQTALQGHTLRAVLKAATSPRKAHDLKVWC